MFIIIEISGTLSKSSVKNSLIRHFGCEGLETFFKLCENTDLHLNKMIRVIFMISIQCFYLFIPNVWWLSLESK